MHFRTRLMIYLNGLLLVTVASVSGLTLFTSVHSLRQRARRDALGTASLLASAVSLVAQAPQGAGGTAGDPAEAREEMVSYPGAVADAADLDEFWHAVQDADLPAKPAEQPAPGLALRRLVQGLITAGNLKAIFLTDSQGKLVTWGSPSASGDLASKDLASEYWNRQLDVLALETIKTLKPMARFRGNSLEASVLLTGFGGEPGALICELSTRRLDEAISTSLWDIVALSIAGLIAGALVSSVLAKRVSGPLHELAEAAKVIGTGGFSHRVRVESQDEVGMLAESFNKMADSLETYTAELARTTAEKEVLAREMDIASEIQRSLLPESRPQVENFEIAAESVPAREVGGDFYDFIPLSEGRWGVVIADASGKGVPAALLMALSRSLIRAYSQDKLSILSALEHANGFMLDNLGSGMFVTCFYAVFDPNQKILRYVNAGHNPVVVTRSEGQVLTLPASGTPLGILEQPGVAEETCELASGDLVMMYTDGITEAVDAYDEQFGIDRLEEITRNSGGLTAAEISGRVLTAVKTFAAGQPQFDDMTVVVIKVM